MHSDAIVLNGQFRSCVSRAETYHDLGGLCMPLHIAKAFAGNASEKRRHSGFDGGEIVQHQQMRGRTRPVLKGRHVLIKYSLKGPLEGLHGHEVRHRPSKGGGRLHHLILEVVQMAEEVRVATACALPRSASLNTQREHVLTQIVVKGPHEPPSLTHACGLFNPMAVAGNGKRRAREGSDARKRFGNAVIHG